MTCRRTLILATALAAAGCAHNSTPPPPPPPPLATQPTVGQEVGAVVQNKIEITFPPNSANLPPDAVRQLDLAARLFRDVGPAVMFAIGHADANGDEFSNVMLSARRARAVKQGLIARGIPPDRLFIQALGESDPITRSDPGAAANRRVTVQWQVL